MEQIGYIDKRSLIITNGLNSIDKLKDVKIQYGYRDFIEDKIDVVQLVCAGVIMTKDNHILILNKNSKSTGKISSEKNKTLLYVGGHLDISDKSTSNIETFTNGMKREILEKLGLEIMDSEIKEPILTYTPISEKSARHLGIIFPIAVDGSFDFTFTDGKCKFVDIGSLNNISNLESWSEIILNEIVKKL
jgi:predicted NUDIX family phosphoesterase